MNNMSIAHKRQWKINILVISFSNNDIEIFQEKKQLKICFGQRAKIEHAINSTIELFII